jgi:hypothetical protein
MAVLAGVLIMLAVAGATALAQDGMFRNRRDRRDSPAMRFDRVEYDGRFAFVRLQYGGRGPGGSRGEPPWAHDYPTAEHNLMRILQELTVMKPHIDESNVFTLDDPALFEYPMSYMSEPGYWTLSEAEATGLRNYLKKGGFVIFDDFRFEHWENFIACMREVLPEGRFVQLDATHPIFHSFFEINSLDTLHVYGVVPTYFGLFEDNDPSKRLMAIANYNNDLGEYIEYTGTGFMPVDETNDAYKFMTNYVIYALTH